ncbi:MBOAT, membrane-bound O-acyltransferase family-domain-containing protein [Boeremia exigua]|uniref:MBOAT, membrane-bound O-acyltransferase family-domain-containing protein n=1 Tax=Boeremia exigua TaxID=749465 RepID=UPI001E8D2F02|nr:MBOAT, membrane-bound O-acyltransferase family-domain-containing protein [Boeremia exigua]KAH6644023.1 MBOAT, membrane-bound O-acyltransferase family-domain-containing protein [Boeremia exigua]
MPNIESERRPSVTAHALDGLAHVPRINREGSWTPEGSSDMDVDGATQLRVSTNKAAAGNRSGNTTAIPSDGSEDGAYDGKGDENKYKVKRKSIQVLIDDSGKKTQHSLTAEDFREIMHSGMQKEVEKLSGKSKARLRDLVFTRQFTTFDRQNPSASQSPFHGFFTLFWIAMALLLTRIAAWNYKEEGSIFGKAEILHLMVDRDLFVLLATDAAMCCATSFGFFLQKAIAAGSVWQLFFTGFVIFWTFWREWPWTHTVFVVLHVFVLLMKQHAYSFYNGYLSRVYRRRNLLEQKIQQLDGIDAHEGPSPTSPSAGILAASGVDKPNKNGLTHRGSRGPKYSTDFSTEESQIASIGHAIEDGEPLDAEQIQAFHRILTTEITILNDELRGKCTTTDNMYPNNLSLLNFVEWTCLPTLVYDLEYPRQEKINWWYVAEKTAATLGVIWVMIVVSQAYIYPVVVETTRQKEAGMSLDERWKEFPWVVSDMLFPMLLEQLLSWYVIWECLLNVLAEITRFADRGFYGAWWNSVSFDQYARDWNRPVHNFLLRHVYHSSISFFHLSKMQATFFTFLLSAIVHEVLMFCIFHKVRGYLFTFQLTQLPLAAFMKTSWMKEKHTLGNVIFWFGLFIGPSVITSLYLIV